MKHFLLVLLILFAVKYVRAQSLSPAIINVAGNSNTQSGIIYEWSAGELALVETMLNSEAIITHGLLQPVVFPPLITGNAPAVYPPNILTANGDGKNDVWIIKDIEKYPDNEVTVFDRSGRVVYKTKNYQNDWTGTVSGRPLEEGTYYYIITLIKGAPVRPVKGFITILH